MRWAAAAVAVFFAGTLSHVAGQAPPSIWNGVFTAEQAERGRSVVQTHCSECHHEDLRGGEAPALMGPTFMIKWETHTVERLFHKIRDTMPTRGSRDVSEAQKLDSVAFILQQNGFPAGATELTDSTGTLAAIRIVPKDGASAPRSGALVQIVGCLQEPSPNKWVVSESIEPRVTTLDAMSDDERAALVAAAPGARTIELISVFPRPDADKQKKVSVKGLYIKTDSSERINVTKIEPLGSPCSR